MSDEDIATDAAAPVNYKLQKNYTVPIYLPIKPQTAKTTNRHHRKRTILFV